MVLLINLLVSPCAIFKLNKNALFRLSMTLEVPSQVVSPHPPSGSSSPQMPDVDGPHGPMHHISDEETEADTGVVLRARTHAEPEAVWGWKSRQERLRGSVNMGWLPHGHHHCCCREVA